MFLVVVTSIYSVLVRSAGGQTYDNVFNLRTSLLTSYNADMLPLNDQSTSLNINLSMMVFTMPEVDHVQGAITMGIMVTQEWYDERLTWTPSVHNGTMSILMKAENIWTPPLAVSNPVKFTLLDTPWMQAMLMADGKVTYTVGGIVEFSCSFYMKFWPFDKQSCSLSLFPYGYPANKVGFTVPSTVVDTDIYTENGEWFLDEQSFNYEITRVFSMSRVTYYFKIARMSSFYVLTVIMPINGIGALTCLVFLLPTESGERVGYSITIMLSLAVFLTMTADNLPKNSEPIPIICVYILFNLMVCIFGLVMVILNLKLYYRTENVPITNFYRSIVIFSRSRLCRSKVHNERFNRDNSSSISKEAESGGKIFVASSESSEEIIEEKIEWKDVSEAIDKFLFYCVVILAYIPSIVILIYTVSASDYNVNE